MLYALTGEYVFGEAGTMCGKLRWEMSVFENFRFSKIFDKYIIYNLPFEGLTNLAPIFNKTVKLSNQKTTQLESDDQSPDEFLELYEPPFKHSSSQNAL